MVACTVSHKWEAGSGTWSERDRRRGVGVLGTGLDGERDRRKQPRKEEVGVNNHGLARKGRAGKEHSMTGRMNIG